MYKNGQKNTSDPIHSNIFQVSQVSPAAMAQWIALAAHGQWAVGSEPIKVIGDARNGMVMPGTASNHKILLCSRDNPVPKPAQKKAHCKFLTGYRDFNQT